MKEREYEHSARACGPRIRARGNAMPSIPLRSSSIVVPLPISMIRTPLGRTIRTLVPQPSLFQTSQPQIRAQKLRLTLIPNRVPSAAILTSHATTISIASPYATPCTAAMTGTGHRSAAAQHAWNARAKERIWSACRAVSPG